MGLFGPDKEKEQMAKNLANLSEQIAKLQQQINDKNNQISQLQSALEGAQDGAEDAAAAKAKIMALQSQLAEAQADRDAGTYQIGDLTKQIADMQAQLQEEAAAAAEAVVAEVGGLTVGSTAYVTRAGGLQLRLRSGPGLGNSVLGAMDPGTGMTLLAGPVDADGYHWWQVRTTDGREGWCAGNDLRTQPD